MQAINLPVVSKYFYLIKKFQNNSASNLNAIRLKPSLKIKILVVEDGLLNQKMAKLILESLGYEVDIAASGEQALTKYNNYYAAILMDIDLPDISGKEISKIIRMQERHTNTHTPIIAVTANDHSIRNECLSAGMDEFTQKPLNVDALKAILDRFIKK